MKIGEGVEWGLHCCALLAGLPPGEALTASRLAEFHGVRGAYLAKHLQALARAGIIRSASGRVGGYRLARPAREISLLEVVEAVEGGEPVFRCLEIRRQGAAARLPASAFPSRCGIALAMERAEAAWREALSRQTVQDLVDAFLRRTDPRVQGCAGDWLLKTLSPRSPGHAPGTRKENRP